MRQNSPALARLYPKLSQNSLDAILVSSPANISYLTGILSRDSYFLASEKQNIYFTDFRYSQEAKNSLKGIAEVKETNGSVFKMIAEVSLGLGLKKIGFEERLLPYAEYKKIKTGLRGAEFIPVFGIIEFLRQIKTSGETDKIRKAVRLTAKVLEFAKKIIRPGVKELEVGAELERFIKYSQASGSSFDIIVASGANSSFPHHISSNRKIKNNESVLVDIGVNYQGYKSDLTRVFFLGKIQPPIREIYNIVLRSQELAIGSIAPGERISNIDSAGRSYIAKYGYGKFFGHSLGHGVGLEVHEEPHISAKNTACIEENMVFTIEPAIYLPGKFGIRIEDMVLVTKGKCEVLSGAVNK